jgi:hypothetical protein
VDRILRETISLALAHAVSWLLERIVAVPVGESPDGERLHGRILASPIAIADGPLVLSHELRNSAPRHPPARS